MCLLLCLAVARLASSRYEENQDRPSCMRMRNEEWKALDSAVGPMPLSRPRAQLASPPLHIHTVVVLRLLHLNLLLFFTWSPAKQRLVRNAAFESAGTNQSSKMWVKKMTMQAMDIGP